ncbi:MFS transporter [Staphylococcus pettenkoferi]|uniref:MFS transporter n=1 Tax=Staphylococcus pettenkoferi TaxID=170573 RepID=UPI002272D3D4|nr:MFS transporter [Staphylococcus pettenkoferi]MCY1589424.1 MFS transporter [Staphylococcus pettenkoferi]MCY1598849.1 MFS transporter [Staphylococcus pettenkoferi]MCY1612388.1 MFS transporter [Staphylococcus pettenkoferi]
MGKFFTLSVTLKSRIIGDFLLSTTMNAIMPFIALYLTSKINAIFAGVFFIVNILVNIVISFIGGYLGDHYNRKKLIHITYLLYSICLILLAITVTLDGIGLVIFCVILFIFSNLTGIGETILNAAIMDAIYEDVREYVYQLNYWVYNASLALGMLLGAALYHHHKHLLFGLFFVAMLVSWYLFIKYYRVEQVMSYRAEDLGKVKHFLQNLALVFKDKYYMLLNSGFILTMMAELSLNSYIIVRLRDEFHTIQLWGIPIDGVRIFTIIMIINAIVVVTMTFKVNQWMTFMRKGRAFIVGILLYAVGYGVLTMSNSFWMLCLVMVIATIGELIYSPIHNAQRFLMIPADKRGTYSAMETICFFGSEILARFGLILGSILLSWQMSIYVVILILIGGALMYIALFKNPHIPSERSLHENSKN